MIKFAKKILLVTVSVLIIIVSVIIYTNIKIDNGPFFKLSKNVKYIVLGHSHPQGAFNDGLIDSTKNISQSGELYFYTYIKAKKLLLENKQIKTVFLEFTNNEITIDMVKRSKDEEDILYNVPKYVPIMNRNEYEYLINKSPLSFIKAMPIVFRNNINSLCFKYDSYISYNKWGGYYYHRTSQVKKLLEAKKRLRTTKKEKILFSNVNLEYLNKIIVFCKQHKIKLFFVRSPQHKEYPILSNEKTFQKIIKNNFDEIPFLDFNKFPLLNEDYRDFEHLNYKGAKKFSLFFNDLLKHGLLQKADKQAYINHQMKKHFIVYD